MQLPGNLCLSEMFLAGEGLCLQPIDAHTVQRSVGKLPVFAAGGVSHDEGEGPALFLRVLHKGDGPLSDDAAEGGAVAAGPVRPV